MALRPRLGLRRPSSLRGVRDGGGRVGSRMVAGDPVEVSAESGEAGMGAVSWGNSLGESPMLRGTQLITQDLSRRHHELAVPSRCRHGGVRGRRIRPNRAFPPPAPRH